MPNLTSVTVTAGVPTAGSGTVSTIDALMADGGQATLGAQADAVVAAGAAGTIGAKLRAISRDLVANIVLAAGTAVLGKVGIDQTTPGTTDSVTVKSRNALWAAGTSNSGLLAAVVSLQTTELNALANAALIISSVGGSSGKFTNNDTGQAKFGEIFFFLGTVTTMTVGGNLSGWFLTSPDSGTTFESLTVVPPRPPDFIVPLDATTGNKVYKAAGVVKLPALQFKVLVQNNSGQAFTATANTLKLAPIAETM